MRKLIIVTLLLSSVPFCLKSQENKMGFDLETPFKQAGVLFLGIENPINVKLQVAVPGEIAVLIREKGIIRTGVEKGSYFISFYDGQEEGELTVDIFLLSPEGISTHLGSKIFRTMNLPEPYAVLGNKHTGNITVEEIQACNKLGIITDNFDDLEYQVTRFEFICQFINTGSAMVYKCSKPELDNRIKNTFKNLQPGDIIIFTNIYASTPGIGERKLSEGLILTIE